MSASHARWTALGSMAGAALDQRSIKVLFPLPGRPETTTTASAG
ncbi:hypothetical protein NQU54_03175 [Streptomyces samsunensis]|uniref:Uncharacterized protein n=1 Tax=Streptomyces malaysiensis subsp. samsunensis TaxID=459658 RepID=A0A9X2RRE9_STRMQ|nr:hypothetical protein [Streptomyces samsunensis]